VAEVFVTSFGAFALAILPVNYIGLALIILALAIWKNGTSDR